MSKISIIIPALNEEEGIEGVIRAIPKNELEKMGFDVQILVVDGNSQDRTRELASKAGAEVIIEPRRGYGRAYKTGFAKASGDIIATADADLTYPVEDIPKFVRVLQEENLDFITTNRFAYMERDAMSFRNQIGNGVLNLATRLLFRLNLRDSQSGMWVFRKDILDKLLLKSDKMSFSEELKLEACHFAKCRWREMPIQYKARVGKIKLRGWRDGFQNLLYLVKKRFTR
ncbi:MAG TPA: glycosyltransferase family 2 protein [Dehalococcoidia bacterium]|nr:glycosyltransferase family 2 protein [Dehalococcoidia bacterium]